VISITWETLRSKSCFTQAAKSKAAEQAGREISTQFFDHVSGSDPASFNPLALVLSYGEDEDDEDEGGPTHGRHGQENAATDLGDSEHAKKVDAKSVPSARSSDFLLEGFLSELQSEGLLDGDDDAAATAIGLSHKSDGSCTDGAVPCMPIWWWHIMQLLHLCKGQEGLCRADEDSPV
jgi:hypothetical protein